MNNTLSEVPSDKLEFDMVKHSCSEIMDLGGFKNECLYQLCTDTGICVEICRELRDVRLELFMKMS